MSKKVELLELDISTENLIKKGADAQKELERLKMESDFLKKSIKEGNKTLEIYTDKLGSLERQGKKNTDEYKNLKKNVDDFSVSQDKSRQKLELYTNSISQQKQEYRNNQRAITSYNKAVESELKIITETDGSINQLNSALANNRKIYRELTTEQRENVAIGGQLFKTISDQDKKYKDLQSSIGTTQVRVGDYKQQIKEALAENSGFSRSMDNQIRQIPVVGESLSKVVTVTRTYAAAKLASSKATDASTGSLKLFRLALISTGIGALLVALGSLVAYFASTQKGIDAVNRVLTPLTAVFKSLFGVVQDLGGKMADAFSSPKKLLTDLLAFMQTNVVNRFKAFGVILKAIANRDVKGIADGVLQLGTGVTDVIDKTKNLAKNTGEFFKDSINKGKELADLRIKIEESENNLIFTKATLLNQLREEELIAKNTSLTATERNKASERAKSLSEDLLKTETDLLDLKIKEQEIQNSLNDTSRKDNAELIKLEAERIDKKSEQSAIELKFLSTKKALQTEEIANAKKIIDTQIANSKTALDLFIAEKGVKAKTLQEDLQLAEQISKKKKDILKAELDAKKITQEEYNLALLQLDNELIQKRAELVADLAQRELQIFKDANQSKLEANQFLTDELLQQEVARLEAIAEKEREYQAKRLDQGVINQTEYNDAIKQVDEDNRIAKQEAETLRDEAQKEKEILDLENKRAIDEERFNNQFAIQSERLERQRLQEVENAKETGADVKLINDKYAKFQKDLEKEVSDYKEELGWKNVAGLKTLFGESSELGKLFAIAEITNTTALNAQKAFAQAAVFASNPLTAPLAVNAKIQGGIIIASGAAQVAKTVAPKFEKGGTFMIGGKPHSQGGTTFYDEYGNPQFEAQRDERMFVLNQEASKAFAPILSDINQQYGGVALSHASSYLNNGGQVLRSSVSNIGSNSGNKFDTSGIKDAVYQGSKEGIAQANIVVRPSEIVDSYNENQAVVNGASR